MPVTQRKRAFQLFRKLKFCSSTVDDDQFLEIDKMMLHALDCLGALSIVLERHDSAKTKIFWHAVATIAELGSDALTGHMDRRHPGATTLIRAFPNDAKATDGRGWLPLHWAAVCDHVTADEIKSIAKADPLAAVKGFNQPVSANPGHLIAASRHPDMKVVKSLYDFYPRMAYTRDNEGDLPLHYAARFTQSIDMIQYLLQANPQATKVKGCSDMIPLHCAIYNEDVPSRYLIANSLLKVDKTSAIALNSDGDTALHLAVHHECDYNLIELLVGANPVCLKIQNANGELPLHTACASTALTSESALLQDAVVELLLMNYPAGAETPSTRGFYPGHLAAERSVVPIVERVFNVFPDAISIVAPDTGTPFHHAVLGHNVLAVKYLVDRFPEAAKIPNNQGYLPFHIASSIGDLEILKILYQCYPDAIRMLSSDEKLPLHIIGDVEDTVRENDHETDVLRFLLKNYAAAVDIPDSQGNTPFSLCSERNLVFRRLFLRAKPSMNYEELAVLNYEPRRMAMFLSFSAINAYGIPSIWVRLRTADMKLLILAVSFL